MMKLHMHYIGGEEAVEIEDVVSYTPLQGWFIVYFDDGSTALYPTDRIEQVGVEVLRYAVAS